MNVTEIIAMLAMLAVLLMLCMLGCDQDKSVIQPHETFTAEIVGVGRWKIWWLLTIRTKEGREIHTRLKISEGHPEIGDTLEVVDGEVKRTIPKRS